VLKSRQIPLRRGAREDSAGYEFKSPTLQVDLALCGLGHQRALQEDSVISRLCHHSIGTEHPHLEFLSHVESERFFWSQPDLHDPNFSI